MISKNTKRRNFRFPLTPLVVLVVSVLLLCSAEVYAEEDSPKTEKTEETTKEPEKKPEKVNKGILGGYTKTRNSEGLDVQTGSAVPGDEMNVISGSVLYKGNDRCEAKLTNNSPENRYSVRFQVIGRPNNSDNLALKKSYSATLKPKESTTRSMRCKKEYSMAVVLKSARSLK